MSPNGDETPTTVAPDRARAVLAEYPKTWKEVGVESDWGYSLYYSGSAGQLRVRIHHNRVEASDRYDANYQPVIDESALRSLCDRSE